LRALRHANGFDRWIADDALEDLDVVGGDERIAAINPAGVVMRRLATTSPTAVPRTAPTTSATIATPRRLVVSLEELLIAVLVSFGAG